LYQFEGLHKTQKILETVTPYGPATPFAN